MFKNIKIFLNIALKFLVVPKTFRTMFENLDFFFENSELV